MSCIPILISLLCWWSSSWSISYHTSESTETVTEALHKYNSFLSDDSHFGSGLRGPEIFMTDDSLSERQALEIVYPESALLLCIFHVLQAFWRYLWDSKKGVRKEHRPALLSLLKDMVYYQTIDKLEENYQKAANDVIFRSYKGICCPHEGHLRSQNLVGSLPSWRHECAWKQSPTTLLRLLWGFWRTRYSRERSVQCHPASGLFSHTPWGLLWETPAGHLQQLPR